MKTKELKINKGITLIALVITIIVLLILAGVSIAMLTGENGILTKSTESKEQTKIAEEKEKVKLSVAGALAKSNGEKIKESDLADELTINIGMRDIDYELTGTETFVVKYLDSGRSYQIDQKGNVSKYGDVDEDVDISEYVKVGDYVNYNPTVSDKSGTPVDAEGISEEERKLVYKSQKGSGTEHGNGNGEQIFTATDEINWQVLDIGNGNVTLISKDVIKPDAGSNFTMFGALGYLYAEQELNEICKIYGYGYGADTSQITKYTYGGPLDGELTGEITGSGARSITIEDINKQAGIYKDENEILKFSDGTAVNINQGGIENYIINIFYPTISTSNGKSNSAGVKNLEYTHYSYSKNKITNEVVRNMLFNGNYFLASRCIIPSTSFGGFFVRNVSSDDTDGNFLCIGYDTNLSEPADSNYAVRPIVTLKSSVIDTGAGYNETTGWSLK